MADPVVEAPQQAERAKRAVTGRVVVVVLTLLGAGVLWFALDRLCFVQATGGYVLPRDAEDWSAWGAWVGGLFAGGALVFAGRQFLLQRRTAEVQESAAAKHQANRFALEEASLGDEPVQFRWLGEIGDISRAADVYGGHLAVGNFSNAPIRDVVVFAPNEWDYDFFSRDQDEREYHRSHAGPPWLERNPYRDKAGPFGQRDGAVIRIPVLFPGSTRAYGYGQTRVTQLEKTPLADPVPHDGHLWATFIDVEGTSWWWTARHGARRVEDGIG